MGNDLAIPDGYLVYDGEPLTEQWFAARRAGITGTDLPKILGDSKYGNALTVWRDKRGEKNDDPGNAEAAHWGHLLEDIVAQEWATTHTTTVEPVGIIANRVESWMRASLDRRVHTCPDNANLWGACGLEIKTRSAYVAGRWREEIPDDVLAQVQWGLMATGFDHMHVAVLIGGQKMSSYRVDRDEGLEAYLYKAGDDAWAAVQQGTPPVVHADAEGILIRELNSMFAKRAGQVELPADAIAHLDQYEDAVALERSMKRNKVVAKGTLVQMLGGGEVGVLDGMPAFTYKTAPDTDTMTADNLRRLEKERPGRYALLKEEGYITRTSNGPTFRLI